MKHTTFILLFFVFSACNKDNYLRLTSSETIQEFIPDYSSPKRFRSNEGDTITLSMMDSSRYFFRSNGAISEGNGSMPDFDYLELQQTRIVIGSHSPMLKFVFDLKTSYNGSLRTRSEDRLLVTFEEEQGKADAEIVLQYTDSVRCLSERCIFQDTLKIQLREFGNVYFTRRDSISRNFLYLNRTGGLIGFKTSDNEIYELIP